MLYKTFFGMAIKAVPIYVIRNKKNITNNISTYKNKKEVSIHSKRINSDNLSFLSTRSLYLSPY
jgi:hypothetical protein